MQHSSENFAREQRLCWHVELSVIVGLMFAALVKGKANPWTCELGLGRASSPELLPEGKKEE